MKDQEEMGRFSVQFAVANYSDVVGLLPADRHLESFKHLVISGVVNSGASRLILPQRVVDQLALPADGETTVRYADQREVKRAKVSDVWLELNGRHGVFSAVVEPRERMR